MMDAYYVFSDCKVYHSCEQHWLFFATFIFVKFSAMEIQCRANKILEISMPCKVFFSIFIFGIRSWHEDTQCKFIKVSQTFSAWFSRGLSVLKNLVFVV